jgi:hypothetical protein
MALMMKAATTTETSVNFYRTKSAASQKTAISVVKLMPSLHSVFRKIVTNEEFLNLTFLSCICWSSNVAVRLEGTRKEAIMTFVKIHLHLLLEGKHEKLQ